MPGLARTVVVAALLTAPVLALDPGSPERERSVGAGVRVGLLRGEPRELASDAGFGFGVSTQWFYRPRLGLRLDATFDRFGGFRDTRNQLTYFGFSALPLVGAYPIGRWIGWAGVGGGLAVGWFRSNDEALARPGLCELDPELPPGTCPASERALLPFARAVMGLAFELVPQWSLGLAAEYTLLFADEKIRRQTDAGESEVRIFGDTVGVAIHADYYF